MHWVNLNTIKDFPPLRHGDKVKGLYLDESTCDLVFNASKHEWWFELEENPKHEIKRKVTHYLADGEG